MSSKPPRSEAESSGDALGRRNFIKQSVVSLGVTVHEYIKHRDASKEKVKDVPKLRTDWLRPPGAVEESLFLDRCTSCVDCVEACPFGAIRVSVEDESPVIFSDEKPCYLCEDFPCIDVCETEALLPLKEPQEVSMGLARVSHQYCTAGQGCNSCVSKCPTEAIYMDFSAFRVSVHEQLCVGCGVCEHVCKTVNDRIAIKVIPARDLNI